MMRVLEYYEHNALHNIILYNIFIRIKFHYINIQYNSGNIIEVPFFKYPWSQVFEHYAAPRRCINAVGDAVRGLF